MRRRGPAVAIAIALAFGCGGKGGEEDAATDTAGDEGADTQEDAATDTATDPGDDTDPDAGEDTAGDTVTDPGTEETPCTPDRPLGASCEEDCQCIEGYECLGVPGETICTIPCEDYDTCQGLDMGCAWMGCDYASCSCRCFCSGSEDCVGDDVCIWTECVGCANDAHCETMICGDTPGLDTPRCRLDTETCICGGTCGDGVCDEKEEALGDCPDDCTGPCSAGDVLLHSCLNGERVTRCTCEDGSWSCVDDPHLLCPGDTECRQRAGECQTDACYEGVESPDPLGCLDPSPLCCLPAECTGAGEEYYPMVGECCPGLVAMTSLSPMESWEEGIPGLFCMIGCWALTCAPCGDGACQPQFAENHCNCPEDCPPPPCGLVCFGSDQECGTAFCRQDGDVCHAEVPICVENTCTIEVTDTPGEVCNPTRRVCEAT